MRNAHHKIGCESKEHGFAHGELFGRVTDIHGPSLVQRKPRLPVSALLRLFGWSLVALWSGACAPITPNDSDQARPTPQEVGTSLAAQIEDVLPNEQFAIVGLLPPDAGPANSLFGAELEDGQRLYTLGEYTDGQLVITGAALEDESGRLILRQDNRASGVSVSFQTGDSFAFDLTEIGMRLTMTLAGTTPPSVLILEFDEAGNTWVNETASFIGDFPDEQYPDGATGAERVASRWKQELVLQATNDCPTLDVLSDTYDATCIGWNAYTSRLPEEALKRACNAADLFLDSYRGSLPFDPSGEIRSRVVAALKIGLSLSCEFVDNIWKLGKLVKKLSVPDLVCMLKSLGDELSRFTTEDGVPLDDVICDLIYGTTCTNTCVFSDNGQCDDGRAGSATPFCQTGTDCRDCGPVGGTPPDEPLGCAGDGVCNIECPSTSLDPDCSATEICAEILYCCPNDGVCDAVYCPRGFADDPDCADEDDGDCEVCCPNDGICDIATCPSNLFDIDCTNTDYCMRLQVCCDDDRCDTPGFPCPVPDYDCGFCGVLDDVCISACSPPDPDCPESGVELGDVDGFVVHALTGMPLSGVVITVVDSQQSDSTDAAGAFHIENVPAGINTLNASLSGFVVATVSMTVTASGVNSTTIGLVPIDNKITAVLSWSDEPYDLDLHLSGPAPDGGRFHLAYFNRNPTLYACLDLDDTSSFGPETATLSPVADGNYVAGSYHLWVHNYSGTPAFSGSAATIALYVNGTQLTTYRVENASGDSSLPIWRVADFEVAGDGTVVLSNAPQTFMDGEHNSEF